MKIVMTAEMPDELGKTFLQHVRDFDIKYRGCQFSLVNWMPFMSTDDLIDALRKISPPPQHINSFKIRR